jgi:putative peptidoglycan lipid II flippase
VIEPPSGTTEGAPGPTAPGRLVGAATGRAIARAGVIVTLAFLASRILGYVRVIVMGTTFGVGADLDVFFAAFRIPDFLFQLVAAGALSSALIPVTSSLLANGEDARAWRVVSTVLTLMMGVLLVLSLVVLVTAPALVPAIAPGFDDANLDRTVELTRMMVLAPVFLAAGAVMTSVLNASGRFASAAIAPLVYNLAIILGAVFLAPVMGVAGLAVGVVVGAAGHVAIQLPSVRRIGVRLTPTVDLRDPNARKALVLMAPRAIGLGGTQVIFLVMVSLASTLDEGAISAFTIAFAVMQIPIGVIGVPLGVVLLPSLSREAAIGGAETYRRLLVRALRLLAYVMTGLAAVGIVLAPDIVRLLFGYGQVDDEAILRISTALSVFLVGLPAHAMIAVLARAFYARQDTATPVAAALLTVGIDVAVAALLIGPLGLTGLAAAIALGAWVEVAALALMLRRRVPGLGLGEVGRMLVVSALLATLGGLAALGVREVLVGAWGAAPGQLLVLARATVATLAGGLVILGASLALRIPEPRTIVGVVVDLLRRRAA